MQKCIKNAVKNATKQMKVKGHSLSTEPKPPW